MFYIINETGFPRLVRLVEDKQNHNTIDPMHKWRQFKYSFVYIQIIFKLALIASFWVTYSFEYAPTKG